MRHTVIVLIAAAIAAGSTTIGGQSPSQAPPSALAAPTHPPATDLDAFMEQALKRRDIDRKTLQDYVLDEVEGFELDGPGGPPLMRDRENYTWFVRDGIHVRSPLKHNGVPIPEADRREYETKWIHSEEGRRKQRLERATAREKEGKAPAIGVPSLNEPRFVSESYFMDFKFEPGNYYLAGKEQYNGHEVLKIDYVPTKLFDEEGTGDEGRGTGKDKKDQSLSKKQQKRQQEDIDINRQMNKTSQVTLWVDPATHQIVKYTFVNVWLDFLPAQYIVKIDDLKASMEMEQPFPGVWLPRGIDIQAGVTMALGSFDAKYNREFSNYRRADVASKLVIPKKGGGGR